VEHRKQRLAKLLARGDAAITYNEHLVHDGPEVFEQACRLGLEGIVSKRLDSPYRAVKGLAQVEKPSARPCGARLRKTGIDIPAFPRGI
jgi:bifunctional non-homologous end joining protein LigD